MLPLVGLAATFVPELIRLIAGDKAGAVAGSVAQAVTEVTGTADPVAARQRLQADAAAAAALQQKLAEIALDATKAQNAEAEQRRQDELAAVRAEVENTSGARGTLQALVSARSPIAYGSPVVSVVVTVGFFVVLGLLIGRGITTSDPNTVSIVNIAVGVLGTAFATVVNFWLGSSSGSRAKDEQAVAVQQAHAAQMGQILQSLQAVQQSHLQNARAALDTVQHVAASAVAAAQAAAGPPEPTAPPQPTAPPPPPKAAGDNFDSCVAITLAQEGGFSDAGGDPGGATNFGITLKTLQEWRGREATAEDVRALTRAEAVEIYRAGYWNPARCGDLPAGVDLMVFDFGVNAGPRTAVKCLQEAVGVAADGSVGPQTLAAVQGADARQVIGAMSRSRMAYYRRLPDFDRFGAGWTRRTEQVTAAALAMV